MAWTDAQQNPHDYLAPGAGIGYSGGISGQYPIGLGVGNYAGALRLGGAPSASSVPTPLGRPSFPGSLIPLPSGRPGSSPGPFGAVGTAGPRGSVGAAPVTTAQALAASTTKGGRYAPGYQGVASVPEIESYIREQATARGIDPNYAVSVYHGEGLSGYVGDKSLGGSYGPYQLFMGGGLGNRFVQKTGLDPRDPSTWQQQVNFALDTAATEGWGAWNGRPGGRSGPTRVGLNGAQAIGGYGSTDTMYGGTMPNPNMRPGRTTDARGGPISPGQFLTAIGPQPRPMGPNDYLVPPGQNIDALTYTGEPAASPTNAVFRLPNANTPPPVSPAATPSIAGGQPYTVKPNDTLWGIAAQTLGDPTQWPTIAQANGIRRGQERNIQPGQQLLIPGGAPAAPPPMPNTTAQGIGPMPPVPTPQARPSIPAPGIPDPRLRPGNQPGPFSPAVSRETVSQPRQSVVQSVSGSSGVASPLVQQAMTVLQKAATEQRPLTPMEQWYVQKAREYQTAIQTAAPARANMPTQVAQPQSPAGTGPDQFNLASAGLGQQTTRMGLQPGVLPQLPEPVGGRQPSAEDQYRLATSGSGNQTTNMSMQPYTLPHLPFPNLPTDTPWGNVPTRQQAALLSPPAGPGMNLDRYIVPPSDAERMLERAGVQMALPTQPGGTPLPPPMPGPNLPGPTQALPITMDPNVAAAIAKTPAIISDQNASPSDSRRNLALQPYQPSFKDRSGLGVYPGIPDIPSSDQLNRLPDRFYNPGTGNRAIADQGITNRDIRIITARTPPVYVAPDGSRIWDLGPIASNGQLARTPEDRGPTDATLRQRGSASRRNMNMDIGVQQTIDRLQRDYPERFLPGAPPLNDTIYDPGAPPGTYRAYGFPSDT